MSNKSVIAITIHTDFKPQIDEKGLFIWGTFKKNKEIKKWTGLHMMKK